jgi:hypothetical protein
MEQNDRLDDKSVDLDVTPEGPYADQRPYPPTKKPNLRPLWIGIVAVAAIIVVTYGFFSGPAEPERAAQAPAITAPGASPAELYAPELPEKAPDAISFSPTSEMTAADAGQTGPATSPSSEKKPAEKPAVTASAKPAAKPADKKPATTAKPAEKPKPATAAKPAEKPKPATAAKPAEKPKPATAAKPAEKPKPAATAKPAETPKPAATAKPATTAEPAKPAATAQPAAPKAAEPQTAATPATAAEAKPAEAPSVAATEPAAPLAISDQWVVNISSTPDAAESLKVLSRVMASKAPGEEVYAYDATVNGVVQHRIRVGFFADRAAAEAAGLKIQADLKLSATPWAVQPTVDEVTTFKK